MRNLRTRPEFRRISTAAYAESKPAPSFVFPWLHSQSGRLMLRTANTVFSGTPGYSLVSYIPGDQHTLEIYRRNGWQS
jgi:hypothetical protein